MPRAPCSKIAKAAGRADDGMRTRAATPTNNAARRCDGVGIEDTSWIGSLRQTADGSSMLIPASRGCQRLRRQKQPRLQAPAGQRREAYEPAHLPHQAAGLADGP